MIAGPKVLEHMVDAVLTFEGERSHQFRLLRATKNLKLVKESMDHSDIASTVRYAHVNDDDIEEGLDAMSRNSTGVTALKRAKDS